MRSRETKIRAILPCAGLGSRLGMPLDKSKEMLLDENGYHLIDYALMFCKMNNFEPHVISRKEKTDLNKYIKKKNYSLQIIKPEGEWQDTVLKSKKYWNKHNILILPDTRFSGNFSDLRLKDQDLVIYQHLIDDPGKWGMVEYNKNDIVILEKPKDSDSHYAWGLLIFTKRLGNKLFSDLRSGKSKISLKEFSVEERFLTYFHDITRNKDILRCNIL